MLTEGYSKIHSNEENSRPISLQKSQMDSSNWQTKKTKIKLRKQSEYNRSTQEFIYQNYTKRKHQHRIQTRHKNQLHKSTQLFQIFSSLWKYNATFVSPHFTSERDTNKTVLVKSNENDFEHKNCIEWERQLALFAIFSCSFSSTQMKTVRCRMILFNLPVSSRLKHLDEIMITKKLLTLPKMMVIALHSVSPHNNLTT